MLQQRLSYAKGQKGAFRLAVAAASFFVLVFASAGTAQAQEIMYTFSGVIRVLDLASPAPGEGVLIPGVDPLGMDGASILMICIIDSSTAPSYTAPNGDGEYAHYNAGTATLSITGSAGGARDGTYTETPCNVRVDDFPIGSTSGGDKLSVTTHWNLGLPYPDEFQVPFAWLNDSTFSSIDLQPFAATEVTGFQGVNFTGSPDAFWFAEGTGIATGLALATGGGPGADPAARISALLDTIDGFPTLTRTQKRFLTGKLDVALRMLDLGKSQAATVQLTGFIRRVRVLVRLGRLTESEGQALIDEAAAIIAQILAGG
jgi:hypothetical protein